MARRSPWEKEWNDYMKRESRFVTKRKDGPTSVLLQKLDRIIPQGFRNAINKAFFKGFQTVFEKGTVVIEKTYNKSQSEADYMINSYANQVRQNRKTARKFTKQATSKKLLNLIISFIEGVGLGITGLALVDIPLFVSVVFKSVYQVALSYGYEYKSEEEKIFILKVIQCAMCDEEAFTIKNDELNEIIDYIASNGDCIAGWNVEKEEQTRLASDTLTKEMLYTKCIQKIPIAGVVGGIFDPVYINRITDYAVLKYRRRFLKAKLSAEQQA